MILLELFSAGKAFDYKWHETKRSYGLEVAATCKAPDGREFHFSADRQNGSVWDLQFAEIEDGEHVHTKTGKGGELAVYATLKKFTAELIEKHKPTRIIFRASKHDGPGRANLYDKMFRKFNFPHYTLVRKPREEFDAFALVHDDAPDEKTDYDLHVKKRYLDMK